MDYYSSQISKLIQELSSLPGIGAKSAQRLAFHILNMPVEQVEELSSAIVDARKNVRYCKECFTLTDDELCPICKDAGRNHKTIMVFIIAIVEQFYPGACTEGRYYLIYFLQVASFAKVGNAFHDFCPAHNS